MTGGPGPARGPRPLGGILHALAAAVVCWAVLIAGVLLAVGSPAE